MIRTGCATCRCAWRCGGFTPLPILLRPRQEAAPNPIPNPNPNPDPNQVRRLYSSAIAKKHVFPPECELTLRVWQLHVLTQIELFTDDSFQFTKVSVRGGVRVRDRVRVMGLEFGLGLGLGLGFGFGLGIGLG